jgi:hypothetical protein
MSETSTLISCTGKITRAELVQVPTPPSTATHVPNPSHCGRRSLVDTLSHRQISVVEEEFAVSRGGMEMFGVLDLAPSSTGADPRLESETRTTSDFGWHELSGYESSCVTILRLGEISVLF